MTRWSGQASRLERERWQPLVNAGGATCCRCGRPIRPDPSRPGQGWEPDHYPIAREFGGTQTQPAHARCNRAAGGRRGAQITNARRHSTPTAAPRRARNLRGV